MLRLFLQLQNMPVTPADIGCMKNNRWSNQINIGCNNYGHGASYVDDLCLLVIVHNVTDYQINNDHQTYGHGASTSSTRVCWRWWLTTANQPLGTLEHHPTTNHYYPTMVACIPTHIYILIVSFYEHCLCMCVSPAKGSCQMVWFPDSHAKERPLIPPQIAGSLPDGQFIIGGSPLSHLIFAPETLQVPPHTPPEFSLPTRYSEKLWINPMALLAGS